MSDIPKSERTESRLRAQHQAYQIRARITAELMASFAYSQKKQEAHIRKMVQHVKDPEAREEMAKAIREQEEDFACWFIKRERDRVADFCQGIASHLRAANTIWPTYMNEFLERRLEMDRAMECCNQLQDELQYGIVLDVQAEFETIKALRQSDNRFLKKIKE